MRHLSSIESLSGHEFRRLLATLRDFDRHVDGRWMIVGSLSYRVFTLRVGTEPGLRDVDLIIYGSSGQDATRLLSPSVQQHFWVDRIGSVEGGYNYTLTHRATNLGLDVFSKSADPFHWVYLQDLRVQVATAESTLYHAVSHLLMLKANGLAIDKKRVFNLRKLWERVDQASALSLLEARRAEVVRDLPVGLETASARDILAYARSLKPQPPAPGAPSRPALDSTVHGIQISRRSAAFGRKTVQRNVYARLRHKLYRLRMNIGM
jgi:hypothetical protein